MHLTTLLIGSLTTGALASNLRHRTLTSDVKRQFGGIGSFPQECESQCQSVSNQIMNCSTESCLCTSSIINGRATCGQCISNSVGDTQAEQADLDSVVQTCAQEGFNGLPDPTLTGGGGGGSIPTTGSGGTSATTGSSGTPATTAGGGTSTSPASNNPLAGQGAVVRVGASIVWSVVVLAVGATFGLY